MIVNNRILQFIFSQLAEWDPGSNFESAGKDISDGKIQTGSWMTAILILLGVITTCIIYWLVKKIISRYSTTEFIHSSPSTSKVSSFRRRRSSANNTCDSDLLASTDSHTLKNGSILKLHHDSLTSSGTINLRVVDNSKEALIIKPEISQDLHSLEVKGEYEIRCNQDRLCWKFKSRIIAIADGEIYITHSLNAKATDRRRYPRIQTDIPSKLAGFIFLKHDIGDAPGPDFVPATLIQIAGPGLLLETTLRINASQKVLVVLFFEETKIVEATGIVKRIDHEYNETIHLAVELVGLTNAELKLMVDETEKRMFHGVKTNFLASVSTNTGPQTINSDAIVTDITESHTILETGMMIAPGQNVSVKIHVTEVRNIDILGKVLRIENKLSPDQKIAIELKGISGFELQNRILDALSETYSLAEPTHEPAIAASSHAGDLK